MTTVKRGARARPAAGVGVGVGVGVERVRWDAARADGERVVLVEFGHSLDYMPVEALVEEQSGHIGLVLLVAHKPGRNWARRSLVRHTARVELPFDLAGRPVRDVEPLHPPGTSPAVTHEVDPDRDRESRLGRLHIDAGRRASIGDFMPEGRPQS